MPLRESRNYIFLPNETQNEGVDMIVETVLREHLLTLADCYAKATKRSISAVSNEIYGNGLFLDDFRGGKRSVSLRLYDDMLSAIEQGWPEGLAKPERLVLDRKRNKNANARR